MLFYRFMSNTGRKISGTTRPAAAERAPGRRRLITPRRYPSPRRFDMGNQFPHPQTRRFRSCTRLCSTFSDLSSPWYFCRGYWCFELDAKAGSSGADCVRTGSLITLLGLLGYLLYQVLFILGIERTTLPETPP